jgi:DNA-binding beta-propeller fold protein YncE
MSGKGQILKVDPAAGIPGGEVVIECGKLDNNRGKSSNVYFNGVRAHLVGSSPQRFLAIVPSLYSAGKVEIAVESGDVRTASSPFIIGEKLADDLHPVANPAFDPEDEALFVTRSGSRGQRVPVSLFRIDTNDEISEFSGEIVNPTAIAFDNNGQMFVTSRLDGAVYRVTPFKEVIPFAKNLGIATGIAFNRRGEMFVGDRTGTIYKVNNIGEVDIWIQLEPSVSAYHLAFGPDDALFVTGPTVSSFDSVLRIDKAGDVEVFYRGLGRPQGIAFDRSGNLYVAASLRGRRGIVRISPDGLEAELVVAGMNVVGLAFSPHGDMIVVTNDSVYRLPIGIYGTLLR